MNNKEHRIILEFAAECNIGLPKENTTLNQITKRTKVHLGWLKKKNLRPTKEERKKSNANNEKGEKKKDLPPLLAENRNFKCTTLNK